MRDRFAGPAYALAVGFWLLTSLYALLSSQDFAYEQFLQPELVPPLAAFARWHAWLNLGVLALTAAVRWPALREPGGRASMALLAAWSAASLALLAMPPLFALAPGDAALAAAALALAPVAGLAFAEWRAAPARARGDVAAEPPPQRTADDFHACLAAALGCTAIYAAAGAVLGDAASAVPFAAGAAGFAQSLVLHALLFLAAFCALTLVRGLAAFAIGAPHRAELALATVALAAFVVLGVRGVLLPGLSLDGAAANAVGTAFGVALAASIAMRGIARSEPSRDAVARVLAPLAPRAVGASLIDRKSVV